MKALLMMGELVLKDSRLKPTATPIVHYYECTSRWLTHETNAFLNMDRGDSIMTFDAPFINTSFWESKEVKYDAPNKDNNNVMEGMHMCWGMKYIITTEKELKVTGSGLVFLQNCTPGSRVSKGPYIAALFRELLAKIGESKLDGLNEKVETNQSGGNLSIQNQ